MLKMLGGKTHALITGFAIVDAATGKRVLRAVSTRVTFKKLSARDIDAYVLTGEPLNVAGGYAIQGGGRALIERILGDVNNIVGLPVSALRKELKKFKRW